MERGINQLLTKFEWIAGIEIVDRQAQLGACALNTPLSEACRMERGINQLLTKFECVAGVEIVDRQAQLGAYALNTPLSTPWRGAGGEV